MIIFINNNSVEVEVCNSITIGELIEKLGLSNKIQSMYINSTRICHMSFSNHKILQGDRIEIVIGSKNLKLGVVKSFINFSMHALNKLISFFIWKTHDVFSLPKRYQKHVIHFDTSNRENYSRFVSFDSKEKDLVEWIETMKEGVFWDVGSNTGAYSVWAGLNNVETVSFEPVLSNFKLLQKNILMNNISVTGLMLALHDSNIIDNIYIQNNKPGCSGNSFSISLSQRGNKLTNVSSQPVIGVTADFLVKYFDFKMPKYVKIDVDGNEDLILKGFENILSSGYIDSIMIEIDILFHNKKDKIIKLLGDYGYFVHKVDGELVDNQFALPSRKGVCFNYLFKNFKE